MPWYRTIIAAGFEDYLRSLGVQEQVIAYIRSAPPAMQQILVNESRKNPAITVQQLSATPQPKKIDPYSPVERLLAEGIPVKMGRNYEQVRDWLLVELKRHRRSPMRGAGVGPNAAKENLDWTPFYNLDFLRTTRQGGHANLGAALQLEVREMQDWADRNEVNLPSFTMETAFAASDAWHEEMAQKGAGNGYEEKNIVFGPKWSGKDFEGWTVQEVRSLNDLEVEGSQMNHCVSDYFQQVQKGKIKIFSLRDPHNVPHVTIETDGAGTHVRQIRGNANNEPKDLYKQMIAEWVKSGRGPQTSEDEYYNSDDEDLISTIKGARNQDIDDAIKGFGSLLDEYGLKHERALPYAKDAYEAIINELMGHHGSNDHYYGWMKGIAVALVNLYVFNDNPNEEKDIATFVEKKHMELDSHLMDYSADGVGEPYPDEDDYDTPEEYDAAVEKFQEKEREYADYYWENSLPYALVSDMSQALYEAQEKKKKQLQESQTAQK